MKFGPIQIILLVLLALGAGWIGSLGAKHWSQSDDQNVGVHSFVHEELDLDPAQEKQLAELESDFGIRRQALDLALPSKKNINTAPRFLPRLKRCMFKWDCYKKSLSNISSRCALC